MFDDFYGLEARPFQLTPDPTFYFESVTHRKALSYLGYGLAQGEGFVAITGEVGSGKSTLVAYLMATGGAAYLVARAIKEAKVVAFEDLGMEAIYEFTVDDMPVTVAVDAEGNNVHTLAPLHWKEKIAKEGLLSGS